jgi:hypothetical protein
VSARDVKTNQATQAKINVLGAPEPGAGNKAGDSQLPAAATQPKG